MPRFRKRVVERPEDAPAEQFTDSDVARIRELLESGWPHRFGLPRDVRDELEVIHHCRGRVRDGLGWELDIRAFRVDEALGFELSESRPVAESGGALGRQFWVKWCQDCGGFIHGRFHVVGRRYRVGGGCPITDSVGRQ